MATQAATGYENFVGGQWVGAVDGGTMDVINPATGGKVAEVPRGTQADVDRAVEAAKKALPEWLDSTPGERMTVLIPLTSEMPHGGYKQFGYGKDLSAYSLEDYTQIKHVMAKIG